MLQYFGLRLDVARLLHAVCGFELCISFECLFIGCHLSLNNEFSKGLRFR